MKRHFRLKKSKSYTLVICLLLLALCQLFGVKEVYADACPTPYASEHQRIGFNFDRAAGQPLNSYDYGQLKAGWYHDYARQQTPPGDIQYYQMVRSGINTDSLDTSVGPIVDANPGAVWFVGNEPDKRYGQDNQTPAEYAVFYHTVYTFLKERDPTAKVAIAGIVQATPIRLAYLDAVLNEYQNRYGIALPVDIMTVHGFILCEVCEWGAGLPPGMESSADLALNFEVSQHIDFEIFKAQIIAMRQWMADRGYRNKPLIVNEYGVLMPVTFEGFGYLEVREFMLNSFDFFRTATDDQIGLSTDGGRLVQEFAWFSLNSEPYNEQTENGYNGELFRHDTGEITQWGRDFAQYVMPLVQQTDVTINRISLNPGLIALDFTDDPGGTMKPPKGMPPEIAINVSLDNLGELPAYGTAVKLWLGAPDNGGTLLDETFISESILANATTNPVITFNWNPETVELGSIDLIVEIDVDSCNPEARNNNHRASAQIVVIDKNDLREIYLPVIQ